MRTQKKGPGWGPDDVIANRSGSAEGGDRTRETKVGRSTSANSSVGEDRGANGCFEDATIQGDAVATFKDHGDLTGAKAEADQIAGSDDECTGEGGTAKGRSLSSCKVGKADVEALDDSVAGADTEAEITLGP